MAASISLVPGMRWSSRNWLFDVVLRYLRQEIEDAAVKSELQEIMDTDLAMLDLGSLPPGMHKVALEKLGNGLISDAEATLRPDFPGRENVIKHLEELADMARGLL